MVIKRNASYGSVKTVYNEWEQVYADKLVCSGYEQEEARQLGSAIQS